MLKTRPEKKAEEPAAAKEQPKPVEVVKAPEPKPVEVVKVPEPVIAEVKQPEPVAEKPARTSCHA